MRIYIYPEVLNDKLYYRVLYQLKQHNTIIVLRHTGIEPVTNNLEGYCSAAELTAYSRQESNPQLFRYERKVQPLNYERQRKKDSNLQHLAYETNVLPIELFRLVHDALRTMGLEPTPFHGADFESAVYTIPPSAPLYNVFQQEDSNL